MHRPPRNGDPVRVTDRAPAVHHPGTEGVIVALRHLEDEGAGCRIPGAPDAAIATLRLPDGREIDVPAHLLRPTT